VFSFQILITLFPNKINHKSAIIFNFQRASSIFTRLTSRIFQDGLSSITAGGFWDDLMVSHRIIAVCFGVEIKNVTEQYSQPENYFP